MSAVLLTLMISTVQASVISERSVASRPTNAVIAGAVVGGVVGLIAILFAGFLLCRRATKANTDQSAWNGLAPRVEAAGGDSNVFSSKAKPTQSTGTVDSEMGKGYYGRESESEADVTTLAGSSWSDKGHTLASIDTDMVPPLLYGHGRKTSSHRLNSEYNFSRPTRMSNSGDLPLPSTPYSLTPSGSRRSSLDGSVHLKRVEPLISPSEYPPARPEMYRTPSSNSSKRQSRKPVPRYDPSDIPTSPLPQLPSSESFSPSSLNHKLSYGSMKMPVHYLMPDLPPPQRE